MSEIDSLNIGLSSPIQLQEIGIVWNEEHCSKTDLVLYGRLSVVYLPLLRNGFECFCRGSVL